MFLVSSDNISNFRLTGLIIGFLLYFFRRLESANDDYFKRNFAWHAITQYSGDVTCNCKNATIIFLRPTPDALAKDRLGLMVWTPFYDIFII